jgi:uncharacterized protein YrrD
MDGTMLNSESTLKGFPLKARDGQIGAIKDFYFDDRHWAIRYLVANSGGWLSQRKVLISPYSLGDVSTDRGTVAVNLTMQQIEDSPPLDSDKPVSRQYEELYHGYFGVPAYWDGPYLWGAYPFLVRDPAKWTATATEPGGDSHLRSANGLKGHHVQAIDGEIGHVTDFLIDNETWVIRYLVIHTSNWWPSKKVLLSPEWIDRVSWPEAKIFVNLEREVIKQAPAYEPDPSITREYETRLHSYYKRPGYWHHDAPSMANTTTER